MTRAFNSIVRTVCVTLAMLIGFAPPALALTKGDIEISGEHEYKAVRLTPPVYNQAKRDLSDLLILDETGKTVPYFLIGYETIRSGEMNEAYPMKYIASFVREGHTSDDFYIEWDSTMDILATSVLIRTDSVMFAKNIELRGSFDGVAWDFIRQDQLYRVDGNEKLRIRFAQSLKYAYYRFTVLNNTERRSSNDVLIIDGVTLEYSQNTVNQAHFADTIAPVYEVEQKDKDTVITLHGLRNVRINEVAIHTDSQFKRPVSFAGYRSKTLYNLRFGENSYQDLDVNFDGYSESADVLELTIHNGDDAPIRVDGISVSYFADEAIFKGENGKTYALSFGDPSVSAAPAYDIVYYKDLILKEGYDQASLGSLTEMAQAEEKRPDMTWIFNVVVVAASLILAAIILLRLKRTKSEN